MNGIVYVAIGNKALEEVEQSRKTLLEHNSFPIAVIDTIPTAERNNQWIAREAKLRVDQLVPQTWENVGYLDADTRIRGKLDAPFELLQSGWDFVIAYSENQSGDLLRHIDKREKEKTIEQLENSLPLQLQAGVFFFNRKRCEKLFSLWRQEWKQYRQHDQAALLRALQKEPVRVFLLGRNWNGGSVVEHLFGRAR